MTKDKNLEITVDEYGRILITNPALLEIVAGASISTKDLIPDSDGACSDNADCSNRSC